MAHQKDSKYLFKLVLDVTGVVTENPIPKNTTDQNLANYFANYFVDKIDKIRDNLSEYELHTELEKHTNIDQMVNFSEINLEMVWKEVFKMQTKSCKLDPIPTKILKNNFEEFSNFLVVICNRSLSEGLFVDEWKMAILKPLLKKENLELINKNYRPVSNLSFLSELVEHIGMSQIMEFCENNKLFPDHQSAYRQFHSCETLLIKKTNNILWAFEWGHVVGTVFLDLSAAFDTVDHEVLLEVLRNRYFLGGTVMDWVATYLKNHQFHVKINETFSETKTINYSVPQGSCNGPVYFDLYCGSIIEKNPSWCVTSSICR